MPEFGRWNARMQVAGMREADREIVGMKVYRGAKSDGEQNLKMGECSY
jgi:hypothetical protein